MDETNSRKRRIIIRKEEGNIETRRKEIRYERMNGREKDIKDKKKKGRELKICTQQHCTAHV
jgi:hypothetical protein